MEDHEGAQAALVEMRRHIGEIDPERAWPWPEPIPAKLREALPDNMRREGNDETFAKLVSDIISAIDNIDA